MARSSNSSAHDQSATLRQLKLIVLVLVLSNIGLGVLSFYLLRNLDRRYTQLIDRSVPVLNDLQGLTAHAATALRATNPIFWQGDEANRKAAAQRARGLLGEEAVDRRKLVTAGGKSLDTGEGRAELDAAGESFARAAREVAALLEAGRIDEAVRKRDDVMLPAFDRYVDAITKAADLLEADSLKTNEVVSESTHSASKLVLGVASWPVLVLVALLVLTAIFVVVLMVLFRGREMSDMP